MGFIDYTFQIIGDIIVLWLMYDIRKHRKAIEDLWNKCDVLKEKHNALVKAFEETQG
jgi:hypothetical protein